MSMDQIFARSLVYDALRTAVERKCTPAADLGNMEHVTLHEIGLSTPVDLHYFKALLITRIIEAGYEIDPDLIPTSATDTPIRIMSELPGHSTKPNKP